MSTAVTATPKKSGKWKSSLIWIIPLCVIVLIAIATFCGWIDLSGRQWMVFIAGILTYSFIATLAIPARKSTEEKKKDEKPADEKKPDDKKPHKEEHHHGPSWFVRFFCIIFAIIGTLYLITKWWPETWAGVKDSYNAFMSDNTEETSSRSRPRKYFTDMVTVTSAGFSPFRLINEKIECTVESGSVKIYVSEWDGSNEHVYNTDGKDHDLQTPHHYRFVAKPGTTAVVSYTITPAQ
jgi:hypothetical protein